MAGRAAELSTLVKRASELGADVAGLGTDRMLPVSPDLRGLFPGGGLRRGTTVAIAGGRGATTLLLATLAAASQAGSWCAVVGMPQLGLVAADEIGVCLERLALVPHPGPQWTNVVSVLLDGFDAVVVAVPEVAAGRVAASVRTQLAARARQRGGVLLPFGDWDGADMTLSPEGSVWHGLGRGRGRLRRRELTVCARGRGSAVRPSRTTFWLPGPASAKPLAPVETPAPAESLTLVKSPTLTAPPESPALVEPLTPAETPAKRHLSVVPS